jgi:hypothetical protein
MDGGGLAAGELHQIPTIHPCQLREYLSDKDAGLTSNNLLNEFYMQRVSDLDSEKPFETRQPYFGCMSARRAAETIPSAYRVFAGPGEIPSWHFRGTVFRRYSRLVFISSFTLPQYVLLKLFS